MALLSRLMRRVQQQVRGGHEPAPVAASSSIGSPMAARPSASAPRPSATTPHLPGPGAAPRPEAAAKAPLRVNGGGFAAAARAASASRVNTAPSMELVAPPDDDVEPEGMIAAGRAARRLTIDHEECIGCGTCVEHEVTVFRLNDDEGKAYVMAQQGQMDAIEDAIDACPVTCISWRPA